MIKRYLIFIAAVLSGTNCLMGQEQPLKREVTLYNPYKPSLKESVKMSLMPDMTDTAQFRPVFSYEVTATPFMPQYTVSPIKAATMQPDPLNKLYRSYVNLGFGSYVSPFAELSITNERSKKGALGFYGRHFSNNGNIALRNGQKPFAGYMDNDLSLFGKKFFKGVVAGGSIDYLQRGRHAYGYNPEMTDYFPGRKETKLGYGDVGANFAISSTRLDSSRFAFSFNLGYDYFYDNYDQSRNRLRFEGEMARVFKGFFAGSGFDFSHYSVPRVVQPFSRYAVAVSPFIKKNTSQWQFKIGMQALLYRDVEEDAKLNLYPDLGFGFTIVPSYVSFFSSLTGRIDINDPLFVIDENPFIIPVSGSISSANLYNLKNTDHAIVVTAGFKGNTGLEGNYELSASYSLVEDMLFYSNIVSPGPVFGRGNYFNPVFDDVDILNLHGGMNGYITPKLSFNGSMNFYKYAMTQLDHLIDKPEWDASLGLKYNLRDKIIAGMQVTALGERKHMITRYSADLIELIPPLYSDEPWHLNLNLSAEYRYSKILSFWAKFNNLSARRYYEWAYYPTHRFMFMLGFTYSL